jgi:ribosome-binding factor A
MRRVESLIQQEIAKIIEMEYRDSEFGLITITHAAVSPDLAQAKIYVIVHDKEKAKQAVQFLNQEAKSLRYLLGNKIKLRRIPELHFYYDEAFERSSRITELLNE